MFREIIEILTGKLLCLIMHHNCLHRSLDSAGIRRKLCGFVMKGRSIGRDGYEIQIDNQPAGWVTSGAWWMIRVSWHW